MIALGRGSGLAIGLTYSEWPLLAESGPSYLWFWLYLNDRFREKQPFRFELSKNRSRVTALLPTAAGRMIAWRQAGTDPKG